MSCGWLCAQKITTAFSGAQTIEPEGAVRIQAKATVSFDIQGDTSPDSGFSIGQLLEGASLGAEATLEVVRVSFPASAAMNFGTLMPCAHIGISTSALGGKIYLIITLLGAKVKVKVFEWKGKEWENFPFAIDCCKFCPEACFENSSCNFSKGECECNEGWDGPVRARCAHCVFGVFFCSPRLMLRRAATLSVPLPVAKIAALASFVHKTRPCRRAANATVVLTATTGKFCGCT